MDNSVEFPKNTHELNNAKTRIGLSNDEIVVLNQTSPGVYHGPVRKWDELAYYMKNALERAGLTKNGKIR